MKILSFGSLSLLFPFLLFSACAHTGPGTRGIMLDCDVPHASLYVDDYYLKDVAAWHAKTMPLAPGFHRIEVVADGYYTYYGEVTVPERGFPQVRVHLRERLE